MKMNKIVLAISLALGIASFAQAADDKGHGTITFDGKIIDSPCSIHSDSVYQSIPFGQVSNIMLDNKGRSDSKDIKIKLEKCNVGDKGKSVTAKFTGAKGGTDGMLGITGTAAGASIALTDGGSNLIKLGQSTQAQLLQNGENTLVFAAYLQGDGASGGIVPGTFSSVTNFTLDYQ